MRSDGSAYEVGDIVLVPFPFTNQTATKKRPAVVISGADYNQEKPDVIIMAVTSQIRSTAQLGEVWLNDWQEAGLLKQSAVKPVIATLEQALIIRTLGRLSALDRSALGQAIDRILMRKIGGA